MIPAPVKPPVSLDLLQRLDIRVGTIVSVEDLPKSQKLLRLRVDFGDHQRAILAAREFLGVHGQQPRTPASHG